MILLTFTVFWKMFIDRMREMKRRQLRLKVFATSKDREQLEHVQAADNFKNLFEVPVIFYLLVVLLLILNHWRPHYYYLMWAFVVARYAHSFVHCTYNRVIHRFYAFASSTIILLTLWILFFADVINPGNLHV